MLIITQCGLKGSGHRQRFRAQQLGDHLFDLRVEPPLHTLVFPGEHGLEGLLRCQTRLGFEIFQELVDFRFIKINELVFQLDDARTAADQLFKFRRREHLIAERHLPFEFEHVIER